MAFIKFSTQDYPLAERLEVSQDIYAAIANIDATIPRGQVPHIETRIRLLPGISIALVECSPLVVRRQSRQLQDGNDDFSLLLNPAGKHNWSTTMEGLGEVECAPGSGCFGFNDRPGEIRFNGTRTHILNISFSRALLGPLVAEIERTSRSPLLSQEPFNHLVQCAVALTQGDEHSDNSIMEDANRLLDLATLAVGTNRDREMLARQRGLREARMKAVKADLMAHAWRGDLSLSWVAKRHGISPGYVRAMFEREGGSFTDYLLGLRLQRVFDRLRNPVHLNRSVADIAYDAGFNNLSWFYRAFKRHFALTPTQVRELAVVECTS
ncbi:helix-turn-helix transcriptional regulator [Bowmanella pacifica]|uniref:HTH araC/xylS-type domain-containing protein n=1 Tax=Bowmanella pacifica TaxID=502051 RepID=A0A917YTU0_9ALTE|nr:helix-turn-helix transcriptional regulator [Bowmanella pacifica]GGO66379.1 hypothetical protein GCM10010982_10430 [Bowmanella pacifica]